MLMCVVLKKYVNQHFTIILIWYYQIIVDQ